MLGCPAGSGSLGCRFKTFVGCRHSLQIQSLKSSYFVHVTLYYQHFLMCLNPSPLSGYSYPPLLDIWAASDFPEMSSESQRAQERHSLGSRPQ